MSSGKIQKTRTRGTHLPLCYLHKLDSVDDAVVIDAYTSNAMPVIARRAENDARKPSISTHQWEHAVMGRSRMPFLVHSDLLF